MSDAEAGTGANLNLSVANGAGPLRVVQVRPGRVDLYAGDKWLGTFVGAAEESG